MVIYGVSLSRTLCAASAGSLAARGRGVCRWLQAGRITCQNIPKIKKVGLAKEVHEQKLQEAQAIAEAVLDAEVRIGELMANVPKATSASGNQYSGKWKNDSDVDIPKKKTEVIKEAGFTPKQVERFQ